MWYGLLYEIYFFHSCTEYSVEVQFYYYFLLGIYQARVLQTCTKSIHILQAIRSDGHSTTRANPDRLNQASLIQNKNGIPIRCKFSPQSETDGTKPDKNSLDEQKSDHTGLIPKDQLGEFLTRLGFAV